VSPATHQTEHGLLCEVVRSFLVDEVQASLVAGRCSRVGAGRVEIQAGCDVGAGCAWSFRRPITGCGSPVTE
jgi:hypothetical protein